MNAITVLIFAAIVATANAGVLGGAIAIAPQPRLIQTVAIAQPAYRPIGYAQGYGAYGLAPQGFGTIIGQPAYRPVQFVQIAAAPSPYGLGYSRLY